ncbi:MAG: hypothetical protein ACP5GD_01285 [Candidatus Micrarchaeia archaeon]|jgi:ABC-type transporter Mla MlaB component
MTKLDELTKQIKELKEKIEQVAIQNAGVRERVDETSLAALVKYLVEERERTNKQLELVTKQVEKLEELIAQPASEEAAPIEENIAEAKPVPLSPVDTKVIEFVQAKGMASAEELRAFMGYKGKNAASARLNLLYKRGLLERYQLGHKVYYRYAGKATQNEILITPPQ